MKLTGDNNKVLSGSSTQVRIYTSFPAMALSPLNCGTLSLALWDLGMSSQHRALLELEILFELCQFLPLILLFQKGKLGGDSLRCL